MFAGQRLLGKIFILQKQSNGNRLGSESLLYTDISSNDGWQTGVWNRIRNMIQAALPVVRRARQQSHATGDPAPLARGHLTPPSSHQTDNVVRLFFFRHNDTNGRLRVGRLFDRKSAFFQDCAVSGKRCCVLSPDICLGSNLQGYCSPCL